MNTFKLQMTLKHLKSTIFKLNFPWLFGLDKNQTLSRKDLKVIYYDLKYLAMGGQAVGRIDDKTREIKYSLFHYVDATIDSILMVAITNNAVVIKCKYLLEQTGGKSKRFILAQYFDETGEEIKSEAFPLYYVFDAIKAYAEMDVTTRTKFQSGELLWSLLKDHKLFIIANVTVVPDTESGEEFLELEILKQPTESEMYWLTKT